MRLVLAQLHWSRSKSSLSDQHPLSISAFSRGILFALCNSMITLIALVMACVIETAAATPKGGTVIFVDRSLPESEQFNSLQDEATKVFQINSNTNGILEIEKVLAETEDLSSIKIISHGHPGAFQLGSTLVDRSTISRYHQSFKQIGRSLAADGILELYGCRTGAGSEGLKFLQDTARITSATVAASVDYTGPEDQGGNWKLERVVGKVAQNPPSLSGASGYSHMLATLSQGDLVVFGWSGITDTIYLVALSDISSGTTIQLTDKGWSDVSAFTTSATSDGVVTWVTSSGISRGTIFALFLGGSDQTTTLTDISNNIDRTGEISLSGYSSTDPLPSSGDGFFVYQDSSANPFFIYGFNNSSGIIDSTGWNIFISSTVRDSLLPDGIGSQNALTNDVNALGIHPSQLDNVQYTGATTSADKATWLSRLAIISNWSGDNTGTVTSSISISSGSSISVSVPNNNPSLSLDSGSLSYTENDAATQISPNATAVDIDGNWDTGSATFQISANSSSSDTLAIGTASGIVMSGTSVTDGSVTFGTASATSVTGSSTITVTFNSNATGTRVQKLVRAITFVNSSESPSTSTRTFSVTVSDSFAGSASATRSIAVTAANDQPTITAPGSIGVTEDTASALTGISFADVDAGSSSVSATLGVGSGTLAASSGGGVTVTGSGTGSLSLAGSISNINTFIAGSNITFTTASNATSTVTLTVGVNDSGNSGSGGAQSASTTVNLTVSAVNDDPSISVPGAINASEDTATSLSGISFADVDAGSASVLVIFTTTTGALSATSGGGVTISGSGTNTMTLTGSIANINTFVSAGNATVTAASNISGVYALGVDISDIGNSGSGGPLTASTTVTLNVSAVNDQPTITAPSSIGVTEDTAAALTGISFTDADAGSSSVSVTLDVGSGTLAASSGGGVTVSGSGTGSMGLAGSISNINTFIAASNITFTTASNATSTVTLTVGVDDGGNTGSGGAQSASTTVNLTVSAVNDQPSITAPSSIGVTEDTASALTGISFTDADAGSSSVSVTLDVGSGTLAASSGGSVTVTGSGTGSMGLAGSISNINTFIAGSNVTFTTASNATSTVTFTVGVNDGGNTGSGGAQSASTTVNLTVSGVNDQPTITAPSSIGVTEDTASALTGISFADLDASTSSVSVTLGVGSGTLIASSGGSVTVSGSGTGSMGLAGSISNINTFIAASNVTFLTANNSTSTVTLTVDVDDGGNTGSGGAQSASTTVSLTVSAVNDQPTITAPSSIGVTEDTASALTGISFADVDAGGSLVSATLGVGSGTLAASSGGSVTVTGSGTGSLSLAGSISNINTFIAASNVTFLTANNATSTVTLTVGVDDDGNTGSGGAQNASATVDLTVSGVNDQPTITAPGSIGVIEDTASALTGISFTDADAGSSSVSVSLGVGSGTLAASSGGSVTVTGSGTASLSLAGSISNINTFIAASNVTFLTANNATSTVSLNVGIDDNGNSGSGGSLTSTATTILNVSAVNDTPILTVPTTLSFVSAITAPITGISVSDVDAGGAAVRLTLSVPSGSLQATSSGAVTVSGSATTTLTLTGPIADLNAFIADSSASFTSASTASENITLTIQVGDNGNSGIGGERTATGTTALTILEQTPTPTPTSTVTPTATPQPSATATSAPIPSATPTAQPTVAADKIAGTIRLQQSSTPVIVYLYQFVSQSSEQSAQTVETQNETEIGIGSTTTDSQGYFEFSGLSPGFYLIRPSMTGLVFEPPSISLSPGTFVPDIQGNGVEQDIESCTVSNQVARVFDADMKSKSLTSYALGSIERFKKIAAKKLRPRARAKLEKALSRLGDRSSRSYTDLLSTSETLPKITLACPRSKGCTSVSLQEAQKRYKKYLGQLHQASLLVIQRVQEEIFEDTTDRLEAVSKEAQRRYRAAVVALQKLPKKTDQCESPNS